MIGRVSRAADSIGIALALAGTPGIAAAQDARNGAPFNPAPGKTCRHWSAIAQEIQPPRVLAAYGAGGTDAALRAAIQPTPAGAALAAAMLKVHNDLRRPLGVPDLTWDATLAAGAQQWAEQAVARRAWIEHAPNVAESIVGGDRDAMWTVEELANRWIAERENFRNAPAVQNATQANPGYNLCWGSGHYQGMIRWTTYRVGCGVATSADGLGRTLVCRYANAPIPAGMMDWPYPAGPVSSWPARPPMP